MRANIARWTSLLKKNRSRRGGTSGSYRTLRVEALEGRVVLSGLPDVAIAAVNLDSSADVTGESSYFESSLPGNSSVDQDQKVQAPGGGPQQPDAPPSPPRITGFFAIIDRGILCVSGRVFDDKEVGGLTVRFGGELNGKTTGVDSDGFFELLIAVPSGTDGVVYAATTDTDGLDSETVSAFLH